MSEDILVIDNVTVDFDGFKALNQLNLSIRMGEMRVVIGPNGAGKTTLLDVISGKVKPTTGTVRFQGKSIGGMGEHRVAQAGIGRKFQTPRIFINLSVIENIELCAKGPKGVFATLLGRRRTRKELMGVLDTVGLVEKANARAGVLSHGQKQWLEIGMVIAQDPALLLIDEPVAGMTDSETVQTARLLSQLNQSHSILVIEHDMEFVREIAGTVSVLHEGSLLCEGSIDAVQSNERVAEVYLGRQAVASLKETAK
jgi:urea transport system ATP-binding protein